VGEHGETMVIDWGLAKDLSEEGAAHNDNAPGVADGPPSRSSTDPGNVLGTPAYMPPEQALGDLVDERADVYAIGAILYALLTGTAPYKGATAIDVLCAVVDGPPPSVEATERGVPAELTAIVRKAMARRPAERYLTARELADDLKRYQTGQIVGAHHYTLLGLIKRFARRNAALLSVISAAIVVLSIIAVLSLRRIVTERDRAERG
jgi:eukaryotic-like serine/threonine-protein kinase